MLFFRLNSIFISQHSFSQMRVLFHYATFNYEVFLCQEGDSYVIGCPLTYTKATTNHVIGSILSCILIIYDFLFILNWALCLDTWWDDQFWIYLYLSQSLTLYCITWHWVQKQIVNIDNII